MLECQNESFGKFGLDCLLRSRWVVLTRESFKLDGSNDEKPVLCFMRHMTRLVIISSFILPIVHETELFVLLVLLEYPVARIL